MQERFHEQLDMICKFVKDRSGWLGLSFVVITVVLYASACGTGGSELVLEETQEESTMSTTVAGEPAGTGAAVSDALPEETAAGESVAEGKTVVVFVCGAVNREGVYTLPEGSRVYEAVEAAGGFDADADQDYVNQAMLLSDGDRLQIPTEEETGRLTSSDSDDGGGDSVQEDSGSVWYGITSGGGEPGGTGAALETQEAGLVNINTADAAELMSLPGIGENKAEAIISYRETNGDFSSKEDLMNVAGIKEGVYGKIEDRICVD